MSAVTRPRDEAHDAHCLADEAIDGLLDGAPWRRFALVGDSLAEGVGDPSPGYRTSPWGERLRDALRRQVPSLAYANLARRGLRTAEIRAAQLDGALAFQPDLAGVIGGGNDLLVTPFEPDAVAAELEAMIVALRATGAQVITWTLQDITRAWPALAEGPLLDRLTMLNDGVREVSARHGTILVDLEAAPASGEPDVYSRDLMHSSMRGHAIIAAATIRRLGEHLSHAASTPR
jgi:lysophospholipase L1-like esterase